MSEIARRDAFFYGSPGFALAFAALPLYVVTPHLYAQSAGLPLAAVGLVLMAGRAVDAIADPFIGRWIDATGDDRFRRWLRPALIVLGLGFCVLMLPPTGRVSREVLLLWMGAATIAVSLANSAAMTAHQGWAVAWTSDAAQQGRLVGAREGAMLAGVLIAAALGARQMTLAMCATIAVAVAAGLLGLARCGTAGAAARPTAAQQGRWRDVLSADYRALLAALGVNSIANAIPATLVLFFVADALHLPDVYAGGALALYFAAAALSIPLWTRWATARGPERTWSLAMTLAIAAFLWTVTLRAGDALGYGLICLITGAALGAELICPALLIGRLIEDKGHRGRHEALYFGMWNLVAKLALAAAAGLALPCLDLAGYEPGLADAADTQGLLALKLAYGGLPCALKIAALLLLPRGPAARTA
jgi:glycoside/pentoside/hexuronide:cation symporter, GPH family